MRAGSRGHTQIRSLNWVLSHRRSLQVILCHFRGLCYFLKHGRFLKFAGQVRLQFAFRHFHSWWWIGFTHLFLFPETHLLSLMSLIKWFSSQHLWFPVGLKMFALSSLLEVFSELHEECSSVPGANSVRAGMFSKKTGYQSPFYFSGRLILHLLFWSNPFELTLIWSYVLHIKTGAGIHLLAAPSAYSHFCHPSPATTQIQ